MTLRRFGETFDLAEWTARMETMLANSDRPEPIVRCSAEGCDGYGNRQIETMDQFGNPMVAYTECECKLKGWQSDRLRQARIPDRFPSQWADVSPRDEAFNAAAKRVRQWARDFNPAGKGLYIHGRTGSGKSMLASLILRTVIKFNQSALWIDTVRTSKMLRDRAQDIGYAIDEMRERERMYDRVSLIVIDDLGAERATESTQDYIFDIIQTRYNAAKPVVVTSNEAIPDLYGGNNQRISSRLHEMCEAIELPVTDYRTQGER